jgi:hypothetical protein
LFRNQLAGFFIPVLSSLFVFSLETPLLSKVGNLFGNQHLSSFFDIQAISMRGYGSALTLSQSLALTKQTNTATTTATT